MIAAIAILTIIDIICTAVGLSLGFIAEGNPLMAWLFDWSVIGTCVIVVLLVGACLAILKTFMDRFKWTRYVVAGLVGVKLFVVLVHLSWIIAWLH